MNIRRVDTIAGIVAPEPQDPRLHTPAPQPYPAIELSAPISISNAATIAVPPPVAIEVAVPAVSIVNVLPSITVISKF